VAEDSEAELDFGILMPIFGRITFPPSVTRYPLEISFFCHVVTSQQHHWSQTCTHSRPSTDLLYSVLHWYEK
jgi:hypothetical protein